MSETFSYDTYLSPFTWRYGSDDMKRIWSLEYKRKLWRQIWVALAEAQRQVGLVTVEQVEDLRAHQNDINIARAHEFEKDLKHDLMAEVHTYAEQCKIGGGIIHLGATSMDIEDNADALRIRDALNIVINKLAELLNLLSDKIEIEAEHVCMAFTHLQPAEPTTIGYRLAFIAQDLLEDYKTIVRVRDNIRGKGIKGAVGTSASYSELLHDTELTPRELETLVMQAIDLPPFEIAHQTYPRRQDWDVLNALAGFAMTAYKFAFDLRLLQSPPFGEWGEPFGTKQIGSSAMPFKRNPINAENMNSLARYIAALPRVAWDNAAHSLLERTLDDSGNRRAVLPDAFLATDELLKRMKRLLEGLRVDEFGIQQNLEKYGIFAATERVLMEAGRNGRNRQELHEIIRKHSMTAWAAMREGKPNPLADLIANDERITAFVASAKIPELLRADDHIGDAPERARNMVKSIREIV
ncbi:MAG: adenylosuccinate lyase [Anaerolineae bacterium]|nr:adenylosuccinate lyase [Anaerolineae bacterium]MDQ7035586.1 adenylosuccinate lyase [Anaerolineae bacterium]